MIIPIYNGEQYIDKCLESIANQYYQNLEILCVVNGSTDASEKMVRAWMERDDRIKLLVTEIADLGHAANLGIDNTSGEYIYPSLMSMTGLIQSIFQSYTQV